MDLIKFATIICFEVEFSLYTLWQFMRRVWRLGQTKPVKVLFLVYQHTLEEAALALIGEKMKAALLLCGANAASAITADADAGEASLLNELATRILKGEQLTADGITGLLVPAITEPQDQDPEQHSFAGAGTFTTPPEPAPVESATEPTPAATEPSGQLSFWQLLIEPISRKPRAKAQQQQPLAAQLSFLDLITA